jgi:hypothetical protein
VGTLLTIDWCHMDTCLGSRSHVSLSRELVCCGLIMLRWSSLLHCTFVTGHVITDYGVRIQAVTRDLASLVPHDVQEE